MKLYKKNESGYEPLNPENELWKGGSYHDTQAFFWFIKNYERQVEIMISGGHGTLSCDEVRYTLYVS